MTISLIAATSLCGVIGRNNKMLWHNSTDLKRFAQLTTGQTVVMGRKTYDSLGNKPLVSRQNIVLTSQLDYADSSVTVAHSLDEAIKKSLFDIWVIGGGKIYELFLPLVDFVHLSVMGVTYKPEKGDILLPRLNDYGEWIPTEFGSCPASVGDDCDHNYFVYSRLK